MATMILKTKIVKNPDNFGDGNGSWWDFPKIIKLRHNGSLVQNSLSADQKNHFPARIAFVIMNVY